MLPSRLMIVLLFVGVLAFMVPVSAQDAPNAVPDVTGLTVAQAARELSRVGFLIGRQTPVTWTEGSTAAPNTISAQSIPAGETHPIGTPVDITIVGQANVIIIYDENDLTLVNQTGLPLDLTQVQFQSSDQAASLAATRWRSSLDSGDCVQIWSVQRNTPKEWEGCDTIHWFVTTRNPTEHFWTELNAVTEFSLLLNGQSQVTCPAALLGSEPIRCEFYLPGGISEAETVDFVYIAYEIGQLALINQSEDRWLPLNDTRFINFNEAAEVRGSWLTLDSAAIFRPTIAGINTLLLAPGQCVVMRDPRLNPSDAPPQDCIVIGSTDLPAGGAFWQADFEVEHARVGERRACPVATRDALTVCILPLR